MKLILQKLLTNGMIQYYHNIFNERIREHQPQMYALYPTKNFYIIGKEKRNSYKIL